MIVRVFLFIFIAINSQVLGDDFSKNWTSKIDFAKVNALRTVKSDDPLPPGYLKMVAKKIYEREELERKKLANSSGSSQKTKLIDDPKFKRFACDYYFTLKNLHHLSRIKKIKICNNLFDRLMKIVSKGLLQHPSGKPSLMMDSSGANSSIVSTTSTPRPSSTSSIITSTESSTTSTSKPNEVITSTTVSSENSSQMQMVNNTELVSSSSVKTMTKNDTSTATSPPDMKDFNTEKISNDSMIDAMNEVKSSNPGATIKNTTDVSTSSSMKTSTPIPSDHDLNNTDISNPAVQVSIDTKNITSDMPGTSESPIDIPTVNNKDNVNLTDSMSTTISSINGTMIDNADKIKQPNPVAAIDNTTDISASSSMKTSPSISEFIPNSSENDSNITDLSNPAVQVANDTKNITSEMTGTSESPIQTTVMNNKDNVNLTSLISTTESSINGIIINNQDKVKQPNPVATIDNTTDVSASSGMEISTPTTEKTARPSENDLNSTDISNPAVQIPLDMKNITFDTSGTSESPIDSPIINNEDNVNLTDSMSTKKSSINVTIMNNPDKDKQSNPVAAIDNTTDVSTSSGMEISTPITEKTPRPSEDDLNSTDISNPAVQVPIDMKNITSETTGTSESSIQTPIMNNKDNVNLTSFMSTTKSLMNSTFIMNPDEGIQPNPAATLDNITDVSASSSMETSTLIAELTPKPLENDSMTTLMGNSAVSIPDDLKNITSDMSGTSESPIDILKLNKKDNVNLIDSMSTEASSINDTMINNLDKVKQPNPAAAIDNTTDVSTSSNLGTSPPIAESTPKPLENDSMTDQMSNPAIQVPDNEKNITFNTSGTSEFPIDIPIINKEDIVNLTSLMSTPESSMNTTMINISDKVQQSNSVVTINNTTDVSTSLNIDTSPPIAESTPKPLDHDANITDTSNPATKVSNDTKNTTSDTPATSESSIQTPIMNNQDVNLTGSLSTTESSMNTTMINIPEKVKQPNPVAAIDNTTDVSTSSSMENSPPISELTPKPTENDSMTTFMKNPADLVPDDSNNITSYTPITSESPIDIIKMLNMNNINFTVSMMTTGFPINDTMINEPNQINPLNLTPTMIVNGTNTTSPIILPQVNRRDGFDDTSDIVSSTQFPIDILMMNNSHILTPLDSTKTDPSTVLSTNNQTENTTSVSPSTTTNSENSTTSKPLNSLPTDDLMPNKKQNSATSDTIPAESSIETSTMSSSHLAANDSESHGTEPSNIPIATDSTMSSSDSSAKDPPFASTATDASNKTSFDDLTPPPLSTNISLNSSTYHLPINQTSDLNPMIPDIPSFNHSLEAPLVPGSDSNLMNHTTSSSASEAPISDSQIISTTLPPQPINSTKISSTTQVPMIPIVMTMISPMNNHSSVDSSKRNESMSANESSTMNPSDQTPITQTSDLNPMIPYVPSSNLSSPGSDSDKKPMTLPPPSLNSVNVTSTTQIPMIPIVMTMSPQLSSNSSNDTSMKDESTSSNNSTTQNLLDPLPINQTLELNPIIPNVTSSNPSSKAPPSRESDSDKEPTILPPSLSNLDNITSTTIVPEIPMVTTMVPQLSSNPNNDTSMRNESTSSNNSTTQNLLDHISINQTLELNPMIPNVTSSNPSSKTPQSPESDSDKKPMTLPPSLFNSDNIASTTQVPMVPIVITMTPQVSSNPIDDTSMKNESTSSNNSTSTTQNLLDSPPINQTSESNSMIPKEHSDLPSQIPLLPESDFNALNSVNVTSTTQIPIVPKVINIPPQMNENSSIDFSMRNESIFSNESSTMNPSDLIPITQTSDLNPMTLNTPSNSSLEAAPSPESDSNAKPMSSLPLPINSENMTSTTQVPMVPIVMNMTSQMNNHSSVESSMRNESISSNESSIMNPSDSIPINQTSDSNPVTPKIPSSNPSSPESDSHEKPMTLPPPSLNSVNFTSTTQIPMIPIVMTMSPQVSSHPINDSSMENESNASNVITTTTPSNSISIDDNSNSTIPNEPSKNIPSNPKNTSSTNSEPSQPLAVTPVPHESGGTLPSANDTFADPFATSFINVNNVLFEDPLGVYSPESSEASSSENEDPDSQEIVSSESSKASSSEDVDPDSPLRPQVVGLIF